MHHVIDIFILTLINVAYMFNAIYIYIYNHQLYIWYVINSFKYFKSIIHIF